MDNALKRGLLAVLALAFVVESFYIGSKGYEMQLASSNKLDGRLKIILDAGHGGLTNTTH